MPWFRTSHRWLLASISCPGIASEEVQHKRRCPLCLLDNPCCKSASANVSCTSFCICFVVQRIVLPPIIASALKVSPSKRRGLFTAKRIPDLLHQPFDSHGRSPEVLGVFSSDPACMPFVRTCILLLVSTASHFILSLCTLSRTFSDVNRLSALHINDPSIHATCSPETGHVFCLFIRPVNVVDDEPLAVNFAICRGCLWRAKLESFSYPFHIPRHALLCPFEVSNKQEINPCSKSAR